MMRTDLDGFVRNYFKSWLQFLPRTTQSQGSGCRIETISSLSSLLPESQQELLEKLKPLYAVLWRNHLNGTSSEQEKDSVSDGKSLQDKLSLIESKLSLITARSAADLLAPPLAFMELALKFSQHPKTAWRTLFLSYYYSGVYDLIMANNPMFKLHFTEFERTVAVADKAAIDGFYIFALQPSNFNLHDDAAEDENLIDKAVIFLRTEHYRIKRLAGPEYKSWYGALFSHSRTTKCDGVEQYQDLLLGPEKLEELVDVIEKSGMSFNMLASQFVGEASVALAPLFIHMAVIGKFPNQLLVKLGIERSSSYFSGFGFSS